MSEISDYEVRISQALSRIRTASEGLAAAPVAQPAAAPDTAADSEETARLRAELEDEKVASAQLEERVKALHERQNDQVQTLETESKKRRAALADLDGELGRLRGLNDQLRDINAALRKANEAGVGEPHLINKSMLTELEALRAARAADRAEIDAILTELAAVTGQRMEEAG